MTHRNKHLVKKLRLLGTAAAISVSVVGFGTAMAQSADSDTTVARQVLDPVTIPRRGVHRLSRRSPRR